MYLFRLWLTFPLNGEKPSAIDGDSLVEVTSLIQTKVYLFWQNEINQ